MKPMEVTVPKLWGPVDAITLWSLIVYKRSRRESLPLRCHEHYHWRQALRWGALPWYLAYIVLKPFYRLKAVGRHPLETPAYAKEREVRAALDAGRSIDEHLRELGMI